MSERMAMMPAANPPHPIFDDIDESGVPQFLRKQKTVILPETDEETVAIEEPDSAFEILKANPDLTPEADLDDVTVEDLKRQQEELDRRIRQKQEAEKRNVIKQIVDVVNQYNIPVPELVDALGGMKIKRKGVKAIPKYQDPVTGAIWTGRGKEPTWIRGQDRDQFLISE
jgi:DNA-binding protein H-NS